MKNLENVTKNGIHIRQTISPVPKKFASSIGSVVEYELYLHYSTLQ